MKVSNQKCIFHISLKNMKATKARNLIAIIAIALTTLLFTALFTIIMSISKGFEQSNFRMVGSSSHGEFKRMTQAQYELLKEDAAIEEYGLRRIVGIGSSAELLKNYTEISFMDENTAKWGFNMPTTGHLPKEGTNEAAADTRVLKALKVPLELGTEFSITMDVDDTETTESFVLCGWWEYDVASPASNVLIPHSRVEEIFQKLNTQFYDASIGSYMMTVMLKNSRDIAGELEEILARYGFSSDRASENYIGIGVNWGYMSEGLLANLDAGSIVALVLMLLLIIFTGYLIIYNIFRISVSNEIRHYGMLKTIGTTGTQIRRMILIQAMVLSVAGIPLGMLLGWGTGAILTPFVVKELSIAQDAGTSVSPFIFLFSVIFAVITVLISCLKPGKIAASVSPIEALRYTEAASKKKFRTGEKGATLLGMAAANLAGSKGKTVLTILSLSLSVVLFTLTITFTGSFSVEKYLSNIVADFQVSCAEYFNVNAQWTEENAISKEEISVFSSLEGVSGGGVTYGVSMEKSPQGFFDKEIVFARLRAFGYEEADLEAYLQYQEEYMAEHVGGKYAGKLADTIQILGMDRYCAGKLEVIEGDLSKLFEERTIAVMEDSSLQVGEVITVSYLDKVEFLDTRTGQVYEDLEDLNGLDEEAISCISINREYHDVEYIVVAKVMYPGTLGYRYYTGENLIMSSEEMLSNIPEAAPLFYIFDVEDAAEAEVEKFMAEYTENGTLDYESKAVMAAEFETFKEMFLVLGSALSFVVALVGMLNFINIVLTGIVSRRKELATLQAIGMTGTQLRTMLIYEGLFYTAGAALVSVFLSLLTIPMSSVLEKMFWFCEYRFTMLPMVVTIPVFAGMGIIIPTITYMIFTKKTVVERLRETE